MYSKRDDAHTPLSPPPMDVEKGGQASDIQQQRVARNPRKKLFWGILIGVLLIGGVIGLIVGIAAGNDDDDEQQHQSSTDEMDPTPSQDGSCPVPTIPSNSEAFQTNCAVHLPDLTKTATLPLVPSPLTTSETAQVIVFNGGAVSKFHDECCEITSVSYEQEQGSCGWIYSCGDQNYVIARVPQLEPLWQVFVTGQPNRWLIAGSDTEFANGNIGQASTWEAPASGDTDGGNMNIDQMCNACLEQCEGQDTCCKEPGCQCYAVCNLLLV